MKNSNQNRNSLVPLSSYGDNLKLHKNSSLFRFALGLIFFVLFTIFIYSLYTSSPTTQPTPSSIITMKELTEKTYKEWENHLQSEIFSIKEITSPFLAGLTKKYEIIFSSGHKAIGRKIRDQQNFIKTGFEVISFQDAGVSEEMFPRRANREYQAWADFASSFVADIINMKHRKLPSILRDVSAYHYPRDEGGILSFINKIFGKIYLFLNFWDQHYREISKDWMLVEPYIENIQYTPPPHFYLPFLAQKPAFWDSRAYVSKEIAGQVSDLLIFDLLVEDHDRYLNHNWISDQIGNLLLWDSGLSFLHGPLGRSNYLDLLCGPKEWRDHSRVLRSDLLANAGCLRICKFRNSTLTHLTNLNQNKETENGIRSLFQKAIENEKINVLEENLYYQFLFRYPKVQYRTTDFYIGLEQKLVRFLSHVEHCVEEFGHSHVFDANLD